MPIILLYNYESVIYRSVGETRIPLLALAMSGVMNVFLNLLFVIVFKMTVNGVATRFLWIYTVFRASRTFTTIMLVYPIRLGITAALMLILLAIEHPSKRMANLLHTGTRFQ